MKSRAELEEKFRTKADELFERVIAGERKEIDQILRDVLGKAYEVADGPDFFVPIKLAFERFDAEALPFAEALYGKGGGGQLPSLLYENRDGPDDKNEQLARLQGYFVDLYEAVLHAIQASIEESHAHLDLAAQSVVFERMSKRGYRNNNAENCTFGAELTAIAMRALSVKTLEEVDYQSKLNARRLAMGMGTNADSSQVKEALEALDRMNDLPPLVKFLIDKENSYASIAIVVDKLLPGFATSSQGDNRKKSRFLAALTGKKAESFRTKWNDHFKPRDGMRYYNKKDKPAIEKCLKEIDEYLHSKKLL